jgi:hypothetical protein
MAQWTTPREFLCDGKRWTVARKVGAGSRDSRLLFHRDGQYRSLMFSRSGVPSERELQSMSEEVLCALLRRATHG